MARLVHTLGIAFIAVSATAVAAATVPPRDTTPVAVSATRLPELSRQLGVPFFWTGPMHGMHYEVRRSGGNVYLRYLPTNVPAGTTNGSFLTVVTYPLEDGYRTLTTIAGYRGVPIAGGGIAYADPAHPGSVHLGFPRSADYQVEVFDPVPSVALRVALSGTVGRVDGAAVAADDPAEPVSRWLTLAYDETAVHSLDSPRLWRSMALAAVTVDDAVNGVSAAQAPSAAAGAAESLLGYLYPDQRQMLADAAAPAASGPGFSYGRRVAARAIARARADGSAARWNGKLPSGRNAWVPTPPQHLPPIEPLAGDWQTWLLTNGDEVKAPAPPAPGSTAYEHGLRVVYDYSRTLTIAQKNLALYWDADPRWPTMAVAAVTAAHVSPRVAATFYGTFFATEYDALVACWASKYKYWEARPVTVIRRQLDPGWSPLLTTPAFPSYVAAHAVLSGAAATVLDRFFPGRRAYFDRQARLAGLSRVYGGIHFPFDVDAGTALGQRVAQVALGRSARLTRLLRPR